MRADQLLCGHSDRPGLLVSVRSADEALAALAAGADVIDVKEPDRGALGAADFDTIADIVRVVNGRVPVTAAAGELVDCLNTMANNSLSLMPDGVSFAKFGLSRCATRTQWMSEWTRAATALRRDDIPQHALPVAVVYADWRIANSPRPEEIHSAAVDIDCRVLLIDTWDKTRGNLFDHWPLESLNAFVQRVRDGGQVVVLAGSLAGPNFLAAAQLRPHLIAVRGAACDAGRKGTIGQRRVEELRQILAASAEPVSTSFNRIGAAPR